MNASSRWLEVAISVDPELVEPVGAVFHTWGQGGVLVEEDLEILPEERGIARRPDRPVRLVTYLPADDLAGERLTKLQEALGHLHAICPLPEIDLRVVDQGDWANAWKEHFPVHRLGRWTIIKPSWRAYDPGPGDLVIVLDPGMAFGTGLHPTTQTCAELVEDLVRPGARVLDLGTGSGILAIQAAHLGARIVDAWDVDPTAAEVARANAQANGVESVVWVRQASLPGTRPSAFGPGASEVSAGGGSETPGRGGFQAHPDPIEQPVERYDLIVANIIANVLLDLAPVLWTALRPGGDCITSGIIAERLPEVAERFDAVGFETAAIVERGDWRTCHLRRPTEVLSPQS